MINHPDVKKKFAKEVSFYNSFFGDTEQIKRWEIMDSEWSVFSGELTPTLKIKREYIVKKYQNIIDKMFENNQ
jgi:long-chain acyl-CoA synthetase